MMKALKKMIDSSSKGLILVGLAVVMNVESCLVNAQSGESVGRAISMNVKAKEDSLRKLSARKFPVYIGGELSLSVPRYMLKSNIPELAGLHVSYLGTNVGGMIGNAIGKLKANVGMYYSDSSVPYEIDMVQGSVSAGVYVLRLKAVKCHTFEPYVRLGSSYQCTKFYGSYLPVDDNGTSTQNTNCSRTDQPLLSRTRFILMDMAAGFECQWENTNAPFIHLFAETSYSIAMYSGSSHPAFNGTKLSNPSAITIGIDFGILK